MHSLKSTPHLLLAGWLLVVGWLASMPGLLPLAFATVAWIDGEHGVEMRGAGEDVSVVLTHGARNAGKMHEQIHHHRLLGRVLTCYASSPGGQTDHVMNFISSSPGSDERKTAVLPAESESDVAVPPVPDSFVIIETLEPEKAVDCAAALRSHGLLPHIPGLRHSLLI